MRVSSLLILTLATAAATAQTNILPTSANGIAGNSANAFPWGTTASGFPGMRIQAIYDSSHFTTAPTPITTPITTPSGLVFWGAGSSTAAPVVPQ